MNKLRKTRVYQIGSMEYSNGRGWREELTEKLSPMGIICFDPYNKPYEMDLEESEDAHKRFSEMRKNGDHEELSRIMKQIRAYDLALCDKADFVIAYIDPKILTVGSWEEFFWCNRMKKVIFLVIEGGKEVCPFWLFGTIPSKYIYGSIDEVVEVIKKIDSGEKPMDSERWRLLKPEFR